MEYVQKRGLVRPVRVREGRLRGEPGWLLASAAVRRGARAVAAGVFSAALLVSSCDTHGGPPPPRPPDPVPGPNPDCVSGSAVDHAREVGLDVDVSVYDSNLNRHEYGAEGERCFTRFERSMIDELRSLVDEGADERALQRVVDDYPVVGPATVWALRQTWDATLADQVHNPALRFYDPDTDTDRLGWVNLRNSIGMSLPGLLLEERGHSDRTPYPVDRNISGMSPPDWDAREGHISVFIDRIPGCERLLSTAQDFPGVPQASADMIVAPHLIQTPVAVRSVLPPGAVVSDVRVTNREIPGLGVPYSDGSVTLRYDVHPDDHPLIGFRAVYDLIGHSVPAVRNVTTDRDLYVFEPSEYPVGVGGVVSEDTVLAYLNPRISSGGRMVHDHTVFVYERRAELSGVGTPWSERDASQPLDYLAARLLEHLGVPRSLIAIPFEPRYADLTIHGCTAPLP